MARTQRTHITGTLQRPGARPENVELIGQGSPSVSKGSFTPTFTGFSADPADALIYWSKVEETIVHILMNFGTGTSDATDFTITNWPAEIWTDRTILVPVGGLVDNGSEFAGGCLSLTKDNATAVFYTDFGFSLWTGSGNKGLNNTSLLSYFTYAIDLV